VPACNLISFVLVSDSDNSSLYIARRKKQQKNFRKIFLQSCNIVQKPASYNRKKIRRKPVTRGHDGLSKEEKQNQF